MANKKYYSVTEASEILEVSTRSIQNRCKKEDLRKKNNKYVITDETIEEWREKIAKTKQKNEPFAKLLKPSQVSILDLAKQINNDEYILTVLQAINEGKHLEEFSEAEYLRFKKRLEEANALEKRIEEYKEEIQRMDDYVTDYRNTIEYLRKSLDKRAEETSQLIASVRERNFIEAKDKKHDND